MFEAFKAAKSGCGFTVILVVSLRCVFNNQVISNGYTNILDLCILSIRVMAATFPTHSGNI